MDVRVGDHHHIRRGLLYRVFFGSKPEGRLNVTRALYDEFCNTSENDVTFK